MCHDFLEALWNRAEEPRRTLIHGILQCAVGFHHLFSQVSSPLVVFSSVLMNEKLSEWFSSTCMIGILITVLFPTVVNFLDYPKLRTDRGTKNRISTGIISNRM